MMRGQGLHTPLVLFGHMHSQLAGVVMILILISMVEGRGRRGIGEPSCPSARIFPDLLCP